MVLSRHSSISQMSDYIAQELNREEFECAILILKTLLSLIVFIVLVLLKIICQSITRISFSL